MLVFSNLGGCQRRTLGEIDSPQEQALLRCVRDGECEPSHEKVMLDVIQLPARRRVLEILDVSPENSGFIRTPEAINAIRSHASADPNLAARILIMVAVVFANGLRGNGHQDVFEETVLNVVDGLAQRVIVSGSDLQSEIREQAISALQAISGLQEEVPNASAKAKEILASLGETTPENDPEILKILQNIPGLIAKGQDAIQAAAAAIAALQAVNNNNPAQQVAAATAAANRAINRKSIFKKPIFWAAVGGSLVIAIGIGAALKRRSHPIVIHRVPKLA